MKKIDINFDDITLEVIQAIEKKYPEGFLESDIVSFSHFNDELEDRVKLKFNDTLYLIKKSAIEDWRSHRYEDGYFQSLGNEEQQDADV